MRRFHVKEFACKSLALMFYLCAAHQALAQTPQSKYPASELVDQYLIPDQQAEIALAHSAASVPAPQDRSTRQRNPLLLFTAVE